MIFNSNNETLSQNELKQLQSERLINLVSRLFKNVPFYRANMIKKGIKPEDIHSINDIRHLPFTTKEDMRETYPMGLLAVDKKEIVEIHTSSGTTGKPVVDAYTKNDIDVWGEVMARTLSAGGATQNDIVHNTYGYGLFTGGLGIHYGARKLGAAVLPMSSGNTARQLAMMQDFKSTILTCTPSYALYIAEAGREEGLDFSKLPLKAGFFGAEPWSENMRTEIESKLHLKAYDIYGLTEIIGPGVASECETQNGLHIFEDHFYPEIIDPNTGNPVPEGQKGELVITTLTKEGTPILRYRTRDITYFIQEPCSCGRTSRKIHRLLGRTDDLLIIRGVNVFPAQIENVLLSMDGIEPHYQLLVDRKNQLDYLEVHVEMSANLFSDEIKMLEKIESDIARKIHSALGLKAKVKLVEPKRIKRSEGKAKRVIDMRMV
ncbi:phenylacetate--CoA ligase family protein [Thermoproteota archaeon]